MFHAVRDRDLPASEKTTERIVNEGVFIMGAASETVVHTLSVATYFLVGEPGQKMVARLRSENQTLMRTAEMTSNYPQLELPLFLAAVIMEGGRKGLGNYDATATDRERRGPCVHRQEGKKWVIPAAHPCRARSI